MHATKYVTTPTARGRVTHLEVEFVTRDGSTETVTGPVNAARLATSTRPRKSGLHVAATQKGMAVCEAVGMDFWGLAEEPRTFWATRGGRFFMVRHVPQRGIITTVPVDAWGTPVSLDTTHPARAGL